MNRFGLQVTNNMANEDNILFGNIGNIYHEVRNSFYYFFSVYSFLKEKIPDDTAKTPLDQIGIVCKKLRVNMDSLYIDFNNHSAVAAADQIRSDAIRWKQEITHLANLVLEIKNLNIQMEDITLNRFLNESLSYSLQQFSTIIDSLTTIQPQDLTREI